MTNVYQVHMSNSSVVEFDEIESYYHTYLLSFVHYSHTGFKHKCDLEYYCFKYFIHNLNGYLNCIASFHFSSQVMYINLFYKMVLSIRCPCYNMLLHSMDQVAPTFLQKVCHYTLNLTNGLYQLLFTNNKYITNQKRLQKYLHINQPSKKTQP